MINSGIQGASSVHPPFDQIFFNFIGVYQNNLKNKMFWVGAPSYEKFWLLTLLFALWNCVGERTLVLRSTESNDLFTSEISITEAKASDESREKALQCSDQRKVVISHHCCWNGVWQFVFSLDRNMINLNDLKVTQILDVNFYSHLFTGRERLIRSHSSARFCFELSGNSN